MKNNNLKPFVLLILLCIGTVSSSWGQTTPDTKKPQAWEITFKTRFETLPNAPQEIVERAKKMNENVSGIQKKVLLSDSLYRTIHIIQITDDRSSSYSTIVNRRDQVVYEYDGSIDAYVVKNYDAYLKNRNDNSEVQFLNKESDPNSAKTIAGWTTKKYTFTITRKDSPKDTVRTVSWYAPKLPNWFIIPSGSESLPGLPLKTVGINIAPNHYLKYISEAVSIKPITLEESDYLPPEGVEIIEQNGGNR